jgi:hypothetical protein
MENVAGLVFVARRLRDHGIHPRQPLLAVLFVRRIDILILDRTAIRASDLQR